MRKPAKRQAWAVYINFIKREACIICIFIVSMLSQAAFADTTKNEKRSSWEFCLGKSKNIKEHNVPCDQCRPAEFSRPLKKGKRKSDQQFLNFRHFSEQFCHCALGPKIDCQWIASELPVRFPWGFAARLGEPHCGFPFNPGTPILPEKKNVICCSGPQKKTKPSKRNSAFCCERTKIVHTMRLGRKIKIRLLTIKYINSRSARKPF